MDQIPRVSSPQAFRLAGILSLLYTLVSQQLCAPPECRTVYDDADAAIQTDGLQRRRLTASELNRIRMLRLPSLAPVTVIISGSGHGFAVVLSRPGAQDTYDLQAVTVTVVAARH